MNSQLGADGQCYSFCPDGWTPVNNGQWCAKNCPTGYAATTVSDSEVTCLRPSFPREIKPQLQCPAGADRLFDRCLLACPTGTKANFNLCVPDCPPGFVQTADGLSCQAEFYKRTAVVREACYANETRVAGRVCLGPCDSGTAPMPGNVEMCYALVPEAVKQFFWSGDAKLGSRPGPLVAKVIFAREQSNATCASGYVPMNGSCFAQCPTGGQALGTQCVADCPEGFKSVNNQTACLAPTQKRRIVVSTLQAIGNFFKNVAFVILAIMVLSLAASRLK